MLLSELVETTGAVAATAAPRQKVAALAALLRELDAVEAEAFARRALADGHEGIMVEAADSPYAAGRRGKAWLKVKPVLTFDLVVMAVEWGSGRREGLLSETVVDGVQRSPRHPGGVALRFARVRGYRPDKAAAESDTISTLRALLR